MLDRQDIVTSRTPAPWSQLGADDAATRWLQVSHQLTTILGMSVDNLRVAREMLVTDGDMVVPMYGHYPVLRSVIEASALAKWIAEPNEQLERIRRSLSARIADLNEDKALHEEAMKGAALYGEIDAGVLQRGDESFRAGDLKARRVIREICVERDIQWSRVNQGLPGYARIIREVGDAGDVPGNYAASVWRIISGLSHPSASRATRFSAVEVLGESKDGILNARLSASMQWTQAATLVAISLTIDAFSSVQRRLDTKQPRRDSAFGRI
ncbi:hypothetical protein GE115_02695 [Agromyces sp. CFH 90414]|uniref:Uncharacterized protein n=1 Tax=Agromyces agglutinans TaxID=2662258 RepID=A0A6I2F064_9MICO|nr:hypothetical protein [Agromyces agglutinans]MRG58785.1 hypothetical protein [Agromyces agglutinans]